MTRVWPVGSRAGARLALGLVLLLPLAACGTEAQRAKQGTASSLPPGVVSVSPAIGGQISIQADRLEPPVLFVEAGDQVAFINRSGRLVHVVLEQCDSDAHFPEPTLDAIWVVFHQPGAHHYAVHFLDPQMRDLGGTVVVGEHPSGVLDPLVCGGVSVLCGCIER
jgi:plastocyanin